MKKTKKTKKSKIPLPPKKIAAMWGFEGDPAEFNGRGVAWLLECARREYKLPLIAAALRATAHWIYLLVNSDTPPTLAQYEQATACSAYWFQKEWEALNE